MNQARVQHRINPLTLANTNLNHRQGVHVAYFNHNLVANMIQPETNGVINDKIQIQEMFGIVTGGDIGVKTVETKEN